MKARLIKAQSLFRLALIASVIAGINSCGGDSPTTPTPMCTIAISPAALAFGADGGAGAVTIATQAGCTWNVSGAPAWVTVTGSGNGTGPSTLAYGVAANSATSARNATLTIGGQSHAITQQGRPVTACTYELSPGSAEFSKDAATGSFAVTAPADCAWTAVSDASWLTLTAGPQGSGNGTVSYAISRNLEITDRRAAVSVADRTFTLRQSGDIGGCEYAVAPVDLTSCMAAATLSVAITTQASCPWTATANVSWLGVPASGSGSATISVSLTENYDAPRDGIVMVRWPTPTAGQNVRVAQAGCLYAVSRNAFSFAAVAGSGMFDVIQQAQPNTCGGATQDRCIWSAVSDVPWIIVTTSMPQRGDNPVAFTVTANDSTTARVGRITVRDKVVLITQAGR
jgi:Viral BACON domain/Putative binding domain, N-terminal